MRSVQFDFDGDLMMPFVSFLLRIALVRNDSPEFLAYFNLYATNIKKTRNTRMRMLNRNRHQHSKWIADIKIHRNTENQMMYIIIFRWWWKRMHNQASQPGNWERGKKPHIFTLHEGERWMSEWHMKIFERKFYSTKP